MLNPHKPTSKELSALLESRLHSENAMKYLEGAVEVIVFGSFAASVARRSSDLDVMVISTSGFSYKSSCLDVVGVSLRERASSRWMQSELASHAERYGVWLLGSHKAGEFQIGQQSMDHKARRIKAFLGSLSRHWDRLDDLFKAKYATKIRRETQRLLLLERKIAVPPTRFLDEDWARLFVDGRSVLDRMRTLQPTVAPKAFGEVEHRISTYFGRH